MCPICNGYMYKHFSSIYICLKCGNKEDALNENKNNR